MSTEPERITGDPSPEQFAEAAAWVAKLHGPNHTLQIDRGLRRWLSAKPENAAAFEAMTSVWEVGARLPKEPFPKLSRWQRIGYRDGFVRSVAAVAACAILAVGGFLYWQGDAGISTAVGEQRLLTLEDGTRVYLNTKSQIKINYDEHTRGVELKSGEALFEVAKRRDRPFVVYAGNQRVIALGTSFVVREEPFQLSVTLIDGKVAVEPAAAPQSRQSTSTLSPGQRLIIAEHQAPKLDTPAVEKITAWRRGLVDFESTPLVEAVAEMNRYSHQKLSVGDGAPQIEITGVFRAGDTESFIAALLRAYDLQVTRDGEVQHVN